MERTRAPRPAKFLLDARAHIPFRCGCAPFACEEESAKITFVLCHLHPPLTFPSKTTINIDVETGVAGRRRHQQVYMEPGAAMPELSLASRQIALYATKMQRDLLL